MRKERNERVEKRLEDLKLLSAVVLRFAEKEKRGFSRANPWIMSVFLSRFFK
jgi:hypothetical protein